MELLISFGFGFAVGGIAIGVLANRRPGLFAHVVTMANHIDDKVNTTVGPLVERAANKAGL